MVKKLLFLGLIIFALFVVRQSIIVIWDYATTQEPGLPQISRICGINFPASSTLVDSQLTGALQVKQLMAKIEMDKSEVENWVKQLKKTGEIQISRSIRIDTLPRDAGTWKPGKPKKFISMVVHPTGKTWVRMLINLDDDHKAVIYLYRTT